MNENNKRPGIIWQSILVFLIILDGILLFLTIISPNLKVATLENMGVFDLVVSLILLVVFLWKFKHHKNGQANYFIRNWTDILALIPVYFIIYNLMGFTSVTIVVKIIIVIKLVALYLFSRKIGEEFINSLERLVKNLLNIKKKLV